MVGQRVRSALDREPFWRRVEGRVGSRANRFRNRPGSALRRRFPQFPNRNFGGGITVGLVEAGVALVLEDTLGIPFGSDTEIVDSQPVSGGTQYTVNIDAPTENMARARAFLEANTGFTSVLTDLLEVQSVDVLRTRTVRDTYQVEIVVRD